MASRKKTPEQPTTETTQELTPEQERERVKKELIDVLLANARKGDARSIDLLGRLKDFDFFARPQPAAAEDAMTERTGRRLIEIAEKLQLT